MPSFEDLQKVANDSQIARYLSQETGFDYDGALAKGHTDTEIARYLHSSLASMGDGGESTTGMVPVSAFTPPEIEPSTTVSGLAGALGRGVAEGVSTGFPEMIGAAGEFIGNKAGLESVEQGGKALKDWSAEKAENWFGNKPRMTTAENIVYEGSKMLGPSVIPGGIAVGASRALLGVGRLAKLSKAALVAGDMAKATELAAKATSRAKAAMKAGSGINAVALFGASQAQNTIDNAKQTAQRLTNEGDHEGARKALEAAEGSTPYLTGAVEALGEYYGTKYLGKLFGLTEGEVVRRGAKELAKGLIRTIGVEVGTETGQSGLQALLEKQSGIRPDADPFKESIEVIGPTVFMTLLTGGLAAAVNAGGAGEVQEKKAPPPAPLPEEVKEKLVEMPTAETPATKKAEKVKADLAAFKAKLTGQVIGDDVPIHPVPATVAKPEAPTAEVKTPEQEEYENYNPEPPTGARIFDDPFDQPADNTRRDFDEGEGQAPELVPIHSDRIIDEEEETAPAPDSLTTDTPKPKANNPYLTMPIEVVKDHAEKGVLKAKEALASRKAELVSQAAHEAATSPKNDLPEPTEKMKEAGNYKLGHTKLAGFDVSIENPVGSERKGVDPAGKAWSIKMKSHYGYLKGTTGNDKDHIDVFINPDKPETNKVYVVDQVNKDGSFDEHKAVFGHDTEAGARKEYLSNYEKGWTGLGAITEMNIDEFKEWAKGNTSRAVSYKRPAKVEVETEKAEPNKVGSEGFSTWYDTETEAKAALSSMQNNGISVAGHTGKAYHSESGAFKFKVYRSPAEIDRLNKISRDKADKEAAAQAIKDEEAKAEREDTDGFTESMNKLERGMVITALNKKLWYTDTNGKKKIYTRRDLVRRLVGDGYRVDGDKLISPDDSFLEAKVITKTAIDYAKFLIGQKQQPAKKAVQPVEVNDNAEQSSSTKNIPTDKKEVKETGPYTFEEHKEVRLRIMDGKLTADEIKAAYKRLKDSTASLTEILNKRTLKQLAPGGTHGDKKSEIIRSIISNLSAIYTLNKSVSYSPFSGETYESALDKVVANITDEDVKKYADSIAKQRADYAKKVEGANDPKTIDDFKNYIKIKHSEGMSTSEALLSLSPEQRAEFDRLTAEQTRSRRTEQKERARTNVQAAGQTTGATILEGIHKKHGHKVWTVQLEEKVDKDSYNTLLANAKRMGGTYVNGRVARMFKADWGFQFKDPESAQAFLELAGGDTSTAKEKVQERRDSFADDRGQSAIERLNEMADRLEERGTEKLNQDRQVNTSRRAGMAARAEAAAESDIALAKIMRNIAKAIESGTANMLDMVRTKTQVELLRNHIRIGNDNRLQKLYPNYSDYLNHKGEKPTIEAADYTRFPIYTFYRSELANIGREFLVTGGGQKLGERILKIADDVTEEYKKFAKENLHRVSTFTKKEGGGLATFTSREIAEKSIKRSGYKGKAIVFQVKRGENIIIMSPSMAVEQGVWKGDDDKKLNISAELAEEIITNSKLMGVNINWHFETTHENRKRLQAIGIETAAEFRTALRELIGLYEQPKAPSKIKQLEREMVGRANDELDFFPTPANIVKEMIETADIQEGMTVLEPSAGMGHIAEQIRESGVEPDVAEIGSKRRELLEEKGFNVVSHDFLDLREQVYDRILMNPPFSKRRDSDHVQHAYSLLKPNGRIVAIMGEGVFFGQDKKAKEFREWLESVGGTSEKLAEGTFLDKNLPVNTGVNSRLVVIDKAAEAEPKTLIDKKRERIRLLKEERENAETEVEKSNIGKSLEGAEESLKESEELKKELEEVKTELDDLASEEPEIIEREWLLRGYPSKDASKKDMLDTVEQAKKQVPKAVPKEGYEGLKDFNWPSTKTRNGTKYIDLPGLHFLEERNGRWALFEKEYIEGNKYGRSVTKQIGQRFDRLQDAKVFAEYYLNGRTETDGVVHVFKGENKKYEIRVHNSDYALDMFSEKVRKATGVLFSKTSTKAPGSTTRSIETALDARFGPGTSRRLSQAGVVHVVASQSQLSDRIVTQAKAGDLIKGAYDPATNTSYLVAENLTPAEAPGLLLHELGTHHGLKPMLGDKYDSVLKQARVMRKAGNKAMQAAYEKAVKAKTKPELLDEETVAYFVQDKANHETSLFKKIVAAIKAWLFKKGLVRASRLTNNDIVALVESAVRREISRALPIPSETSKEVKYAKSQAPPTKSLSTVQRIRTRVRMALTKQGAESLLDDGKVKIVQSVEDLKGILGEKGVRLMTAWHGSPHKFDKFSMEKIGTGEGAYNFVIFNDEDVTITAKYAKDGTILGATFQGTSYLVADNLDGTNTTSTLIHELTHGEIQENGWEGLLGKRYEAIKAQVERMVKAKHKGLLAAQEKARKAKTPEADMFEETISYFVGNAANTETSLFKRIMQAINSWLTRVGVKRTIKAEDLVDLAQTAIRRRAATVKESLQVDRVADAGEAIAEGVSFSKEEIIRHAKAFYSRLEEVAANAFTGMKAQVVKNFLSKNGVKKIEMDAVGLDAFLAERKPTDKVTQRELLDFVQANTVELEDVVMGETININEVKKEFDKRFDWGEWLYESNKSEAREAWEDDTHKIWESINKTKEDFNNFNDFWDDIYTLDKEKIYHSEELDSIVSEAMESDDRMYNEIYQEIKGEMDNPTHFSQYTEPGAVEGSYREMFVTAPDSGVKPVSAVIDPKGWPTRFGDPYIVTYSDGTSRILVAKSKDVALTGNSNIMYWRDGHSQYSEIKNPIVRLRFNTVEADGKKLMRLEEVQGPNPDNQKKMPAYLRDNIYQIATKRALSYAKENGFDGVALATKPGMTAGETQADRYSLAKQVDGIGYAKNNDGTFEIQGFKGNETVVNTKRTKPEELEATVGKSLAKKIIDGEGKQDGDLKMFFGDDLKITDTGLLKLYDTTIPKMLEAYGKGKMADTSFSNPSKIKEVLVDGEWMDEDGFDDGYLEAMADGSPIESRETSASPTTSMPTLLFTDQTPASYPMFARGMDFKPTPEISQAEAEKILARFNKEHGTQIIYQGPQIMQDGEILFHTITDIQRDSPTGNSTFGVEGEFSYEAIKEAHDNKVKSYVRFAKAFDEDQKEVAEGMLTYQKANKKDMSLVALWLSSIEHYADKIPVLKRYKDVILNRAELKHMLENTIFQARTGVSVVDTFTELQKNDQGEYDKLAGYLVETDRSRVGFGIKSEGVTGLWSVYAPGKTEPMFEGLSESEAVDAMIKAEAKWATQKGFADDAVFALISFRSATNAGFDLLAAQMRAIEEDARTNNQEVPTLTVQAKQKRWAVYRDNPDLAMALFAEKKEAALFIENELERKKVHDGATRAMTIIERTAEQMAKDPQTEEITLTQALAEMGDMRGTYFPRQRTPGAIIMVATKEGENPILKKFDAHFMVDQDDTPKSFDWIKSKFNELTPLGREARKLTTQGYDVNVRKDDSVPEDVFDAAKLVLSVEGILSHAVEKSKTGDTVIASELAKLITVSVADIFKGRGFLSSRIARNSKTGKEVWVGYEEDPLKAISGYAKSLAGGIAKRETAKEAVLVLTGKDISWQEFKKLNPKLEYEDYAKMVEERRLDPGKQKTAYHAATTHFRENMRNEERLDRIIGTMKGLAVLKFLGFRISSALVNLTNMAMAVPATMNGIGKIPYLKTWKYISRAATTYAKYRRDKAELEDRDIFELIKSRGWDEPKFNMEATRALQSKLGAGWDRVMSLSMAMFGATEKVNRATTIFASYKALVDQGMNKNEAIKKAKEISDKAHGVYGKATLPHAAMGKGLGQMALRMGYVFQKFSHNYLLTMMQLGWTEKEYGAALHMLMAPAVLAGAGASVAMWIIKMIAKGLGYDDDPEEELYEWANAMFGGGEWLRHGLVGLGGRGVNLKGSLQINFAVPTTIKELLGAPYAVLEDVAKGTKALVRGDAMKGIEKILPTGLASPVKAFREYSEGVTTGSNIPVFYDDVALKGTAVDAVVRAFSFNPSGLSGKREHEWNLKTSKKNYDDYKSDIYARMRRFYLKPAHKRRVEDWVDLLMESQEFNEKVKRSGRDDLTPITSKQVRITVKKMKVGASHGLENRTKRMLPKD